MAKAERDKRRIYTSEKQKSKKSDTLKTNAGMEKNATHTAFSLLADEKSVNPALSSLFAANPTPPARPSQLRERNENLAESPVEDLQPNLDGETSLVEDSSLPVQDLAQVEHSSKRKRKRKDDGEAIEDAYMRRLAREEAKEAAAAATERAEKRLKTLETPEEVEEDAIDEDAVSEDDEAEQPELEDDIDVEDATSPPPRHETQQAADTEVEKAKRTVFLGNVSTNAISSKSSRKTLLDHLKFFFPKLPKPKAGEPKHAIESIRFRSTPYASAIPKKASFAKKEVMDSTTKSTNAYAVYSSATLAREATKRLNGTVILDRHLRVDSVAHPAPVDNRRCVFVGNLGFVDDESNIQAAADEDSGKEKRKRSKQPSDIEEGLWRAFGKCGTVESVRVIRDSATRVGKGIAYVQFEDGNAVEAALLYEGRNFPPMLPRKLRVSRAKAQKRNAKPGSGRPKERVGANGYQRKVSGEEASKMGRAGKLLGRAAAAQVRRPREMRSGKPDGQQIPNGIKKPEAFVFEGHRASNKGGKAGLKLGKKKGGKPTHRGAQRGAAYKAGKSKK